jgi:malate dehydrogenase (oxaloacetate-decarboxylating)(NADP+)
MVTLESTLNSRRRPSMSEQKRISEALEYHEGERPGKTQVVPTKATATQHDLSLAYSPGVAEPCLEIARDPDTAFRYTNRGNLVAVVSNGSAVLGLGNIGALAGKPVMEGKAVLFKRFADIDVFDLELNSADPEDIIRTCEILEPTFGGINLEDIKAPECFEVEERLKKSMDIPVFHDDQHGTAIIAGAGILNACEITERDISALRVVINGAGAAGIATGRFLIELGVTAENVLMCDSKGVIRSDRGDTLNPYKAEFARATECVSLADALVDADAFVGVSVKDVLTPEMIRKMAPQPLIFALANPDPEIRYELAKEARPDAIVATGRTDYPNQVNNVLGFPYLFRGALDVRARGISEGMKVAAAKAIAALAKEAVPDVVLKAYNVTQMDFGTEYIIPKPFDPRVLWHVAPAVAEQATKEGLARMPLADVEEYREQLRRRFSASYGLMRGITVRAQEQPKKIVLPQGADSRILRSARRMVDERIARPVVLGNLGEMEGAAAALGISLEGIELLDPKHEEMIPDGYVEALFECRGRKGLTLSDARRAILDPHMRAAIMLLQADADAVLGGLSSYYATTLRPALQILPLQRGRSTVCAVYIAQVGQKPYFLADCCVNPEPNSEQLAEIALATAQVARDFDVNPRVAMLSYSNFGSADGPESRRVRKAVAICHERAPELPLDGEMHVDTALDGDLLRERHPFSKLSRAANVLVFPNLSAANGAYKLLQGLGDASLVGPIVSGLSRSVHVIQRDAEVGDIVNLAAIAVLDAQRKSGEAPSCPLPGAKTAKS